MRRFIWDGKAEADRPQRALDGKKHNDPSVERSPFTKDRLKEAPDGDIELLADLEKDF